MRRSPVRRTERTDRPHRALAQPPSPANQRGVVKWQYVTTGVTPLSRHAPDHAPVVIERGTARTSPARVRCATTRARTDRR